MRTLVFQTKIFSFKVNHLIGFREEFELVTDYFSDGTVQKRKVPLRLVKLETILEGVL